MKHASPATVLLVLCCLAAAVWILGYGLEPSSAKLEQVLLARLEDDAQTARDRVVVARLGVDEIHGRNTRRVARRDRLRERVISISAPPRGAADRVVPGTATAPGVPCATLLRVDDRLVKNLRLEIGATRGLLSHYEELAAAQARELEVYRRMRAEQVRKRRLRRYRNRGLAAAAVVVTVIALAD